MIDIIEITNIKGIEHKRFELQITPNRPSLLVAPNGFGKSSFATAFDSLNQRRIVLNEADYYKSESGRNPRIYLALRTAEGLLEVEATNNTNSISSHLGISVIKNVTKPKGNASTFGGFANAKANLIIEDIVIVERIPNNVQFAYTYRQYNNRFGNNGNILPNLNAVLNKPPLMETLTNMSTQLQRMSGLRVSARITDFIATANAQAGTSAQLLQWITNTQIDILRSIQHLNEIAQVINRHDIGYNSEAKAFLAAIQLHWLFNDDRDAFFAACETSNYKLEKWRFEETLATFNATWKDIRASQSGDQLIVRFPKATDISNGQRDILTFISSLCRAKNQLKKSLNILIIDEVFDYLDDANLTAAQYYITKFIEDFKASGRVLYPLILTHLNPSYFKNFAFNDQKVYYLDKSNIEVDDHIKRLLRNRDNASIKDDVSKYLLHYNPNHINKRDEFRVLNLPELWGTENHFRDHAFTQVQNYIHGSIYDPFGVCAGVRLKVEQIAFNKLQSDEARTVFIVTHKTRDKLKEAQRRGIESPESHYLLAIIYNEGMHWKDGQDNVSPIASKLENLTVKKLIGDLFASS